MSREQRLMAWPLCDPDLPNNFPKPPPPHPRRPCGSRVTSTRCGSCRTSGRPCACRRHGREQESPPGQGRLPVEAAGRGGQGMGRVARREDGEGRGGRETGPAAAQTRRSAAREARGGKVEPEGRKHGRPPDKAPDAPPAKTDDFPDEEAAGKMRAGELSRHYKALRKKEAAVRAEFEAFKTKAAAAPSLTRKWPSSRNWTAAK